jgi:hypothetical protein
MSRELRAKVEEYLRIRRALGFKLEGHAQSLSAFIDHLERIGASTPTVEAALEWVSRPVEDCEDVPRLLGVRNFGLNDLSAGRPDDLCNLGERWIRAGTGGLFGAHVTARPSLVDQM